MSEARYPAWLDVAIDRCPACGGEDVVIEDDEAGGWMALTAPGRWALHGLGHPLGVAR